MEKGDQFKIKIPFSGSGPFDFKVKANGRELREGDRIKISPFDDYVTLIIKGILCDWMVLLLVRLCMYVCMHVISQLFFSV